MITVRVSNPSVYWKLDRAKAFYANVVGARWAMVGNSIEKELQLIGVQNGPVFLQEINDAVKKEILDEQQEPTKKLHLN
jgi:hypothetical protein